MKSREIKFRAWVKTTENMYSWSELPYYKNWWSDKDYILMQYTGLKDKNGKEIYEGDILRHDLWGVTKVYWEASSFWADNGKEGNDYIEIQLGHHQLKRTRIIGNIYENEELLNETKE